MRKPILAPFFITILCFIVAVGCSGEDEDRDQLATMEQEILSYVGASLCEGESTCRSIGFGSKPCGGPWSYLIYSVSSVDSLRLFEMVSDYNRFNTELNEKHHWESDCSVPSEPVLGCVDGRCVDLNNPVH